MSHSEEGPDGTSLQGERGHEVWISGIDVGYLRLKGSQVRTKSENPAAGLVWAEGQGEVSEF